MALAPAGRAKEQDALIHISAQCCDHGQNILDFVPTCHTDGIGETDSIRFPKTKTYTQFGTSNPQRAFDCENIGK